MYFSPFIVRLVHNIFIYWHDLFNLNKLFKYKGGILYADRNLIKSLLININDWPLGPIRE